VEPLLYDVQGTDRETRTTEVRGYCTWSLSRDGRKTFFNGGRRVMEGHKEVPLFPPIFWSLARFSIWDCFQVYAIDQRIKNAHATWHEQDQAQCLLIAQGKLIYPFCILFAFADIWSCVRTRTRVLFPWSIDKSHDIEVPVTATVYRALRKQKKCRRL